jgi:tetratricopeptide (TPR) repeat protein
MMTTKKQRRAHFHLVVVAAIVMLVTACGPPGARQLRRGEQYTRAGQFAEAVVVLRDATRILADAPHPVQSKAWNLFGLACHGMGQLDAADKAYREALKLDRDNAAINYNLGCLRLQQTNFPGAIDYLTTYVALRPNDVQGYLRLATAHFHYALERPASEKSRFLESARHDLESAEGVSASAETVNALGVLQMQRRPPGADAIRAASANFELALHRDSYCAPAMLNLAIVSQQYLNNPARALQLYRAYLKLAPPPPYAKEVARLVDDLDISQRISITRASGSAPATAPSPAPSSARMNVAPSNPAAPRPGTLPANSPAHVVPAAPEKASAANSAPSVPEPVVTDTAPSTNSPGGQHSNPLLGSSGKPKTNDQASAAAELPPVSPGARYDYPPPVTLIPGDRARAKRLLAEAVRARQSRYITQSITAYQDAIAADPTFYEASFELGLAAIEDRDYPTALEALHRALTLQGDSAAARYAFAWTLQKRGYFEDAAHELDKLLGQHPENVRAHLLLGNLYAEKLHQTKLAREQFTQALQLDPANAQAATIRAWLQQQKP